MGRSRQLGEVKGSYYRRIEDIDRALSALKVDSLPDAIQFLVYYFGCEKLARGIVGIHKRCPPDKVYRPGARLELAQLEAATVALGLVVRKEDLAILFTCREAPTAPGQVAALSARVLRNKLNHHLGPTHVRLIAENAPFQISVMKRFLRCKQEVLAYLEAQADG